jgi:drug/metabolite transporter (DMT)-like permease
MVALHLTSPVILIATDVARGSRTASVILGGQITLIAGAILLVAVTEPEGSSAGNVVAGSALALGSAVAVAVLISQVAREAEGQDADVAAGVQLALAAVLTAPLAITAGPAAETVVWLLLVGVGLLGPGFALYWRALRGLDAPLASILGLNEAVVASFVGALAFDAELGLATLAAAALILAAVVLELRGGVRRLRQSLACA